MARATMTERQEQQGIVKLFKSIGGVVYVLGTVRKRGDHQGTMQTPGLPDIIAFLPDGPGRQLVFVEVKSSMGQLSAAQRYFRILAQLAGVVHLVGGVDVVLTWLREQEYVR